MTENDVDDRPCPFCGEMTSSVAGNPSRWPLVFTLPNGTGKTHRFHVGCVMERLFRHTEDHELQLDQWRKEKKIL